MKRGRPRKGTKRDETVDSERLFLEKIESLKSEFSTTTQTTTTTTTTTIEKKRKQVFLDYNPSKRPKFSKRISETTTQTTTQELPSPQLIPSEVTSPPRISLPANTPLKSYDQSLCFMSVSNTVQSTIASSKADLPVQGTVSRIQSVLPSIRSLGLLTLTCSKIYSPSPPRLSSEGALRYQHFASLKNSR